MDSLYSTIGNTIIIGVLIFVIMFIINSLLIMLSAKIARVENIRFLRALLTAIVLSISTTVISVGSNITMFVPNLVLPGLLGSVIGVLSGVLGIIVGMLVSFIIAVLVIRAIFECSYTKAIITGIVYMLIVIVLYILIMYGLYSLIYSAFV